MASEHQNSTEWKRCTSNLSVRGLVLTKGALPAAEVDAPPAPMAGELVGQGLSTGLGLNKDACGERWALVPRRYAASERAEGSVSTVYTLAHALDPSLRSNEGVDK